MTQTSAANDPSAGALSGALRKKIVQLSRDQELYATEVHSASARLRAVRERLTLAPDVEIALEALSQKILDRTVRILEEKLSIALQEVLEQPIRLRADHAFRRGSANLDFYIERDGQREDILGGQGGSVANVLSVGLRLFALTTLDPRMHRRFLLLDEQDCWLRPDLVPHLVKIIREAGKALGFQVILVSHHELGAFRDYADRVYRFIPQADGSVQATLWQEGPSEPDIGA